jgi:hypothetical protein
VTRTVRAVALAALAAITCAVTVAGPASATPGPRAAIDLCEWGVMGMCLDPNRDQGCKAPAPADPGYLWQSAPRDPSTADPFAPGATVGVAEVYGVGGFGYTTCDLSVMDTGPLVGTQIANVLLAVPKTGLATLDAVSRLAFDPSTWVHYLDPMVDNLVNAAKNVFWVPGRNGGAPWASVALLVAALMLVGAARRGDVSAVVTTLGAVVLTVTVVAAVFSGPTRIAELADPIIPMALGTVSEQVDDVQAGSGDARTAAISAAVDTTLYRSWLRGTFGDADSPTAVQYGPCLLKSKTFSWTEKAAYDADPGGAGKKIVEGKAEDWKRCSEAVEKADPGAYQTLQGKRSDTRIQSAAEAFAIGVASQPMILIAFIMMIVAYVIFRLLVIALPLAALWWITPRGHRAGVAFAKIAVATIANATIFGFGSITSIVAYQAILDPRSGMDFFLRLILMGIFSLLLWLAMWPFMRLTSWRGPANPTTAASRIGRTAGRAAWGVAKNAFGAYLGIKAAGVGATSDDVESGRDAAPYSGGPQSPERVSAEPDTAWVRPPLPPGRTEPEITATVTDQPRQQRPAVPVPALATSPERAALPPATQGSETGTAGSGAAVDIPTVIAGSTVERHDEEFAIYQATTLHQRHAQASEPVDEGPDYRAGYDSGLVVESDGSEYVVYTPEDGYHSRTADDPAATQ